MRRRHVLPALLIPALALGLGACADPAEGTSVVVTAYPLQFIAERVAGDAADVTSVAPAGTEPHDVELSPSGVAQLTNADVVLMLSGFQAAVDDALEEAGEDTVVVDAADSANLLTVEDDHGEDEAADDHGHGGVDPHFWLDPQRVADVADAFADALAEADPGNAEVYEANAATLRGDLETVQTSYEAGLAECDSRTLVTSHEAFGYLAAAFDLEQVGITGLDPEAEPSPSRIAEVLQEARDAGVTTIFNEPGAVVPSTNAIADELGVTLATLDPIEIAPTDSDYLGQMEANLAALREGLECS